MTYIIPIFDLRQAYPLQSVGKTFARMATISSCSSLFKEAKPNRKPWYFGKNSWATFR